MLLKSVQSFCTAVTDSVKILKSVTPSKSRKSPCFWGISYKFAPISTDVRARHNPNFRLRCRTIISGNDRFSAQSLRIGLGLNRSTLRNIFLIPKATDERTDNNSPS